MSSSCSPPSKPFEVMLWTSSHGSDHHFLPNEISNFYSKHQKMQSFMAKPLINAKPGRLMNSQFIAEFTKDFESLDPSTTRVSIILMGDNDLRSLGVNGGSRVLNNSKKLIELHKDTNHALLLMGLMPSPATHQQTDGHADYCDFRVRKEVAKAHETGNPRFIGFVQTSTFFNDPEGFIRNKLYFCLDGVHLRQKGARCLARHLMTKSLSFMQVISGILSPPQRRLQPLQEPQEIPPPSPETEAEAHDPPSQLCSIEELTRQVNKSQI